MLVGLVLVQQGKGADMGAAFGGGGANTLFGAGGATSLIVKLTTGCAVAFMVTSIILVKSYNNFAGSRTAPAGTLSGSVMDQQQGEGGVAPVEAAKDAAPPVENAPEPQAAPAGGKEQAPAGDQKG